MTAAAAKVSKHRRARHEREGLLKVIAAFKLVKALFLIAVGLGAVDLLDPTAARAAERWAAALAWQLGPRAMSALADKLSILEGSRLALVAVVAFLYAALFVVEGVGLWKTRRWAEYLTIIATASFVPLEVYEIFRSATLPRIATLVVNLLVVGYLVWKVRQTGPSRHGASSSSGKA
jgi:uncharacterized membrane protein (DUF2068 family)